MSGGKYDYKQHHIRDIYEEIEFLLEAQGKLQDFDMYENEYYYETFRPDVEEAMKEGVEILKKAYVYAHRIDWYLSGDDGEDNFLRRLKEDLEELRAPQV